MKKQRVLVYEHLSAGGEGADAQLLAEGEAMRDAIVAGLGLGDDLEVSCAAGSSAGALPGHVAPLAPHSGESHLDFVAREARAHDWVWVVAPETGGLLAAFSGRVDARRWIGCDRGALQLATRKRATLLHLARHGLRTPLSFRGDPRMARWVVKPDDGAGSVDTRVYECLDEARRNGLSREEAGQSVSLEPWVSGEALSLSLMCGSGEVELLSVNTQHVVIDAGGWVSLAGVEHLPQARNEPRWHALHQVAQAVGRAMPGLLGFVGVDLVWHPQQGAVVIEVNPRLTSAFVGLSERLQRPLALEILALFRSREARHATA